jgi:hypothetical protein
MTCPSFRNVIISSTTLLAIFLFTGCAYNVNLDPTIDPTASIANKIPYKVGLYVPEEIKSYRMGDNSDWAHSYTFNLGDALDSMLGKVVDRVFIQAIVLESYPTSEMILARNLDGVTIPKITSGKVALSKDNGFFQDDADGSTVISLQLTFYNDELIEIGTVQGSGMGVSSKGIGAFSTGKEEYTASVEEALRNLGNDLIHQIHGSYLLREEAKKIETATN